MHQYRREIDGLRALAILPVLFFHFDIPGFSGGFVGVDIFFVISGFLIGGILWGELSDTGRVRLGHFYLRRIRRLAPVYFAVILTCLVIGWLIMLPFDFRALGKEIISSSVYLSNVYFFSEAGYFDTAAKEKILLHTWSLSVEEQFYIFLPLTLLLLKAVRSSLPVVLGLVGLVSFIACIAVTPQSQTATFYLFPFRAWEMLAGVLLAVAGAQRGLTWDLHPALSWGGVALMGAGVTLLVPDPSFPGWKAAVPVLGAVLIIANGKNTNLINQGLSSRVLVFIGLISYSLYLWHWPIVTLSTYYWGEAGSLPVRLAKIALSVGVAYLSWRFIEGPTRRARISPAWLFTTAGVATAGAVAAGALLFVRDGLPARFDPQVRTHIEATRGFRQDWRRCSVPAEGGFAGIEVCPIGPEGEPRLLIWGDSHVRAFKEGLEQAAFEHNVPALIIWRAGCVPAFGLEKSENTSTPVQNTACGETNRQIEAALNTGAFDTVLLIGRWTYYTQGVGVGRDVQNTIKISATDGHEAPQDALVRQAMQDSIATLTAQGRKVFVLRQAPEIFDYDSRVVARALAHGRMDQEDVARLSVTPLADLELRNAEADRMLAALTGQAEIIDPWPFFCDDTGCSAMWNGRAEYLDNNHVINTTAKRLRGIFAPVFDAAGGVP
ncbi:acyltransferase family protein [Neptunicoccus sediminis]|uniref:acyltransferase family protein n=1 Tax=Neptunicoccus sediminis TaxID=1892596 RepID=UPI000845C4C2|nr:acyltransferase family protein [Neptunicoccus sediminis]